MVAVRPECYYVYAYGEIEGKYQNAGEAIQVANEKVGVVVNQNQQIVWKRGTRSINTSLSVTNVFADGGKSSYDACLDKCVRLAGQTGPGRARSSWPAFPAA